MRNINIQNQVPTQAVEQMKKNPIALVIEQTLGRVDNTLDRVNIYGEVLQNAQDILAHARLEQELAREINRVLKANTVAEMFKTPNENVLELATGRKIDVGVPVGNTIILGQAANDDNYRQAA